MAHAIDTTTGKAAAFFAGQPAWHRLGKVVSSAQSSVEAITLAGLNWKVEQYPITTTLPSGKVIPIDNRVANVRTDTNAVLGVVGDGYTVFQNSECFDFMDTIVGEKLAMFETAGSLHGGRKVWMLARIPKELRAGPQDVIHPYVLLSNGHDGLTSLRMVPTTIRVVCQNTLSLALREAGNAGLTIYHCENLQKRVDEARRNLGIITGRVEKFQEELDAMVKVTVTDQQAVSYFRKVFRIKEQKARQPVNVDASTLLDSMIANEMGQADAMQFLLDGAEELTSRQAANNARLLETLIQNYHNNLNTIPGMAHTPWALTNAVTEYVDHMQRGHNDDTKLNSMWFGQGNNIKVEAYRQALAMAV